MTEVDKFMELRDKAIKGLSVCDVLLNEAEILELGFENTDYAGTLTSSDEYEFTVYSKGEKRIVFIQTYVEREGGLYFQSLYTDRELATELEKPLVLFLHTYMFDVYITIPGYIHSCTLLQG